MLFLKDVLTHQSPFIHSVPLISLHNISFAIGIWGLYTFAILLIICQQDLPGQICRSEHAFALFLSIYWEEDFSLLDTFIFFNLSPFAICYNESPTGYAYSVQDQSLRKACVSCFWSTKHRWIESCEVLFIHKIWSPSSQVNFSVLWPEFKEFKTLRIWYILVH